ncbi:MAG: ABC transporter permease [Bacilli bacterium]|nr:ABC transporter permease [Bacilli bacterium]
MKNKLKFLVGQSLKKKVKTKWFVIANVIILIAIAALINIDHVINLFGGDFNELQKVYVIDNTSNSYDVFLKQLKMIEGEKTSYEIIKYDKQVEDAKKEINDGNEPFIFIFDNSSNTIDVTFISKGYVDLKNYQVLYNAINNTKVELAIISSSVTQEELNKIYSPVNIKREYIDKSKSSKEENSNMMMSTIFPVIILPFFMLTIFLVQMIGAEVNDEKSTRGMEIIISNVSPKVHFFSKVIAGNLFVLIQGALLFVYGGIGLLIRKLLSNNSSKLNLGIDIDISKFLSQSIIDKLIYIIPITLILMVLTFIAYGVLAGVLASMTTNTEDFQQLQTPIIIISLAGYYLAMMSNVFEGAIIIRVLSYFPLISAILSPSLLLLGQIGIIDMVISIVIMILTNYIFIKYGLKIYKEGILNYTSKHLWKKMWRAVKN